MSIPPATPNDRPLRPDPKSPITTGEQGATLSGVAPSEPLGSASQAEDFASRLLEAQIVANDQPFDLRHVGGVRFLMQVLITFLVLGYCGWQLAREKNPDKTLYATTGTTVLAWWISSPGSRR